MRAVRLCLAGVIVASLVVLVGGSARAGGGTWELDGRPTGEAYYEPGSTMTATADIYLWPDGKGRNDQGAFHAGPEHGPFFFYVAKSTEGRWGPFPPPLPEDAILVGEVNFERRDEVTWDASGTFTLPHLDPGDYSLLHCNDPCTRQLGDIMSTPFSVVASEREGELLQVTRDLERRADDYLLRIERLERALNSHRTVENTKIEALQKDLRRLANDLTRLKRFQDADESRVLEGSLGAGAALTAAGAAWLALRRRGNL